MVFLAQLVPLVQRDKKVKVPLPLVCLSKDRRESRVRTVVGAAMVSLAQKAPWDREVILEAWEQKVKHYFIVFIELILSFL